MFHKRPEDFQRCFLLPRKLTLQSFFMPKCTIPALAKAVSSTSPQSPSLSWVCMGSARRCFQSVSVGNCASFLVGQGQQRLPCETLQPKIQFDTEF